MIQIRPYRNGSTRGFLHQPAHGSGNGLVLTHGAGGNCETPLLIAVAEAFASAGVCVLRCNLPFRQSKRFGPPFARDAAKDRAGLADAVHELRAIVPGRVFLGGHSYGGRQASILAAEQPGTADALLLFSYPLHPPKKIDDLRTTHFHDLFTPAMFTHGTRDPFGSPEELQAAIQLIPAQTLLFLVENAGHDLLRGKFDLMRLLASFEQLVS